MELLGERSWWIPAWLDRIVPRVSIEGQGFFDDEPREPAPAVQTNVLPDGAEEPEAANPPQAKESVPMSVIMMLRVKADPARLQEVINGDESRVQAINSRAKELGAIHHRFLGNADGTEVIVLDEWESPEAFQKFYEASPEIGAIMQDVGVSSAPEITFWQELDTVDKF